MKNKERAQAIELRINGYSLLEISKELNVAKSSVSNWVKNVDSPNSIALKNKLLEEYAERRKTYYENPKKCKNCKKNLDYKKKDNIFCSIKCRNPTNIENIKNESRICNYCKKITRSKRYKFCSLECQLNHHWEKRIEETKKNGYAPKKQATAKIIILKMRGYKCEICETKEWRGQKVPLVLDHINGHHEDNRIENLRLVCGNCDMQLPTYKSKNKGNGRKYDREYKREYKKRNKKELILNGELVESGLSHPA